MTQLILNPTATAQWLELVEDAENSCHINLDEDVKSYLVFLLMRYIGTGELASNIMALEYLNNIHLRGQLGEQRISAVGDKCLLFSGLFPGRAQRRRVRISYYVQLGSAAYARLGQVLAGARAELYDHLAEQFVLLMDILHATRELGQQLPSLEALQAMEVWEDTGSTHARETLKHYTQATPVYRQPADDGRFTEILH